MANSPCMWRFPLIWVVLYFIPALVLFTVFGLQGGEIGMWASLSLSLIWPVALYWIIITSVTKVIPWKV